MHFSTLVLCYGLAPLALAAYSIQDDYSGNNFFSKFTFDTFNDPTSGYANFVDGATAQAENLTSVINGVVTVAADSKNVASGRGRNSVRLTSTNQYTHGLVVMDLAHMPGSAVSPLKDLVRSTKLNLSILVRRLASLLDGRPLLAYQW